jgi:hypothetical protein
VSSRLEAKEVRKYALILLDSRKQEFSSARKLSLSRRFSFPAHWHPDGLPPTEPNWIPEAVTDLLLYHNPDDFTCQDIHDIGDKAFLMLFKAILALERERRLIGLRPPNVDNVNPAPSCNATKHVNCKREWGKTWIKYFLPHILHPVSPTPFSIIQSFVRATLPTLVGVDISPFCAFDFATEITGSISTSSGVPTYPVNVAAIIRSVTASITSWYQQL